MREQGELAYENLNMMLTVQKLTEENQRLREALRDNETFVKTWSDEYDAMKAEIERLRAEIERLRAALKDAGESLEWAARRLNDNCASKADVMAVHFAAGQTTKARRTGGQE